MLNKLITVLISAGFLGLAGCATAPKAPRELTILTYNIHHGEGADGRVDLPRIAEIIKQAQPDLVALQEVDRNARRSGGRDQAAELASLTGMHHVFGAAMPFEGGEYGQAILSRKPILESFAQQLPQRSGREPRISLNARIAEDLWFVSTHLDHQIEDIRVGQAEALLESLKERTVILAGDFNARPTNRTMRVFSGWTDAAAQNPQPTIPAEAPRNRIDYILLHPQEAWQVLDCQVLEEAVASDHRPVRARVRRR